MDSLVSFVVDGTAESCYHAELLLFSLEKFGEVQRNRILVQCGDRVAKEFLDFLREGNYPHRMLSPSPDLGRFSKIRQLEGIEDWLADADGVYLIDTGLVAVAPLGVPDRKSCCGVAAAIPDLSGMQLEQVCSAAGIGMPAFIFDPGLVFMPRQQIQSILPEWSDRVAWLSGRPELTRPEHIEQLALAMALKAKSIPAVQLAANHNFTCGAKEPPASFEPNEPVRLLNHQGRLDPFGLLDAENTGAKAVRQAAASFNVAIAGRESPVFFRGYKRQQSRAAAQLARQNVQGESLMRVFEASKLRDQPRRRLILHAGSPKTGTTSLQHFLDENRGMLLGHGILYPEIHTRLSREPKHQWLSAFLLDGNAGHLAREFAAILGALTPQVHMLLLSTEGIFNHWWDFPVAARAELAELAEWFDVQVWIWLREPASFMKSYYLQKLCNPRNQASQCNGTDMSAEDMLQDAWIVRHLDYLGFVYDMEALFGQGGIKVIPYTGDTIADAMEKLGLPYTRPARSQHNVSLGMLGVDLVRVVNRYDLGPQEKQVAVDAIKKLESGMAGKSGTYVLDEVSRTHIRLCFALQENILRNEFGLTWEAPAKQTELRSQQAGTAGARSPGGSRVKFF